MLKQRKKGNHKRQLNDIKQMGSEYGQKTGVFVQRAWRESFRSVGSSVAQIQQLTRKTDWKKLSSHTEKMWSTARVTASDLTGKIKNAAKGAVQHKFKMTVKKTRSSAEILNPELEKEIDRISQAVINL